MANTIQIKRSNDASKTPGSGSVAALASGELAFNFAQNSGAGKLFFGIIQEIQQILLRY